MGASSRSIRAIARCYRVGIGISPCHTYANTPLPCKGASASLREDEEVRRGRTRDPVCDCAKAGCVGLGERGAGERPLSQIHQYIFFFGKKYIYLP